MKEKKVVTNELTFVTKTRAVLYARQSSGDGAEDGLESQLALCEAFATEQGYLIVDKLAEDVRGVSGGDRQAPALNKALEMAQAGLYDVLVIRDVKRYSRDSYKAMDFDHRFFQTNATIEYVWNAELNGLPRDGVGSVMRYIQHWMSQEDRKDTVHKLYTKRLEVVSRKGSVMTHGRPPYGYNQATVDSKTILVINEQEARWVRKIFEWYAIDGLSIRAVAHKLRDNLVPRPGVAKPKGNSRKGPCEWSHTTVSDILRRKTYMGMWEYAKPTSRQKKSRKHSIIGAELASRPATIEVPAIVGLDLFNAAQGRLAKNKALTHKASKFEYLLRGRVKCGLCGYACRCVSKVSSRNNDYHVYACNARSSMVYDCRLPTFKRDVIDRAAWGWLVGLMNDDTKLAEGYQEYLTDQQDRTGPLEAELARIDTSLEDLQGKLVKQAKAIGALESIGSTHAIDVITNEIMQIESLIDSHLARKGEIETELAQTPGLEMLHDFTGFVDTIRAGIVAAQDDFAAKQEVIKALDVTAELTLEDGQPYYTFTCVLGATLVRTSGDDKTRLATLRIRLPYKI